MEYTEEKVREKLWQAYEKCRKYNDFEGKSSEGYMQVSYPAIWDCDTLEEFRKPDKIMIYSYALGPSRQHYIFAGDKEKEVDYNEWISQDIFKKAWEIIDEWEKEFLQEVQREE